MSDEDAKHIEDIFGALRSFAPFVALLTLAIGGVFAISVGSYFAGNYDGAAKAGLVAGGGAVFFALYLRSRYSLIESLLLRRVRASDRSDAERLLFRHKVFLILMGFAFFAALGAIAAAVISLVAGAWFKAGGALVALVVVALFAVPPLQVRASIIEVLVKRMIRRAAPDATT